MKVMILKNFIVFEGIDGAGTSTQIKKLVERGCQECGEGAFVATAEPTGGETGRFLRRMLGGALPGRKNRCKRQIFLFQYGISECFLRRRTAKIAERALPAAGIPFLLCD